MTQKNVWLSQNFDPRSFSQGTNAKRVEKVPFWDLFCVKQVYKSLKRYEACRTQKSLRGGILKNPEKFGIVNKFLSLYLGKQHIEKLFIAYLICHQIKWTIEHDYFFYFTNHNLPLFITKKK